ncbi:MAG: FAD-dependent monooxygenase, partial [Chloroflexi bacterium]|nr:FAD-dependent monooxygenase [Chloroflexota bacterium]
GCRALHACLPRPVWNAFDSRSGSPPRGIAFTTQHLRPLTFISEASAPDDPVGHSRPISRIGLREILLTGLEDAVHYDKRVVRYEHPGDGSVVVHLADGTSDCGDVLVGADGSSSAVRKQLVPRAELVDAGVAGIAGKLYLNESTRAYVPADLLSQMTMVLPWAGMGMFMASLQHTPGSALVADVDLPDHLFWVIIGRPAALGLTSEVRSRAGAELQELALARAAGWHPLLRSVIRESATDTIVATPLHTARPVQPWATTNVTLLGDAIHTMPPLQGLGGNTAILDAALLRQSLVDVDRGRTELCCALREYERTMLRYGFEAVRRSVQVSDAVASTNRLGRAAFAGMLRVTDLLPPLRRAMFERPTATATAVARTPAG